MTVAVAANHQFQATFTMFYEGTCCQALGSFVVRSSRDQEVSGDVQKEKKKKSQGRFFPRRPIPYCLNSDGCQSSCEETLGFCCQLHSTKGKTKCSVSPQKNKKLLFVFLFTDSSSASVILSRDEFILHSHILVMQQQPEIFVSGRRQ